MYDFLLSVPLWAWAILLLWDLLWKAIALWRAARANQLTWFVAIMVINTIGILPIIYLLTHRAKKIS